MFDFKRREKSRKPLVMQADYSFKEDLYWKL